MAQTAKVIVPAVAVDTVDDNVIKTVPIVAVTPDQKEVEVATVIQTTPPAAAPAPVAVKETEELPKTASSMPLIALLGGLSISLAIGLKLFLKLAS